MSEKIQPRFPEWLRMPGVRGEHDDHVAEILHDLRLNTVCSDARCPNRRQCFHSGTATFLILGNLCTRNCRFCAIGHAKNPPPPEPDEPARVAEGAVRMKLKYVVVTSVTRDDLPDGGASVFAALIRELRRRAPQTLTEVLTSDFRGDPAALRTVLDAAPAVFNHNIETVRSLSPKVRSVATYDGSLRVLRNAAEYAPEIPVKSGLMLGLGESASEIERTLNDLREAGVKILTMGQYLSPSRQHHPVSRFVPPEEFSKWEECARSLGFSAVAAAPLVRSSYHALELYRSLPSAGRKEKSFEINV